jgi:tRNA(Ile)-lysidine synthase
MALLALATAAGLDVEVIHLDHGLRVGSAQEAEVVRTAAQRFGARFVSVGLQLEPGPNLEARARQARYARLPAGVMTGHTADDLAETVLVNQLRGAAGDGLRGLRSTQKVSRPMLGLRRAETHLLCSRLGLQVVVDPSNSDPRFVRNRVRHELLPAIADIAGRDPVPILVRQAGLMAEESELLDALALALDPTDARALAKAPRPLARRALRRWLRGSSDEELHPPSAAEVERVLTVVRGEALACELSGGRRVSRHQGRLMLSRPSPGGLEES